MPSVLILPCIQIEVLNQTREEMSMVSGESLCQLVLDWIRRQADETTSLNHLSEKVFPCLCSERNFWFIAYFILDSSAVLGDGQFPARLLRAAKRRRQRIRYSAGLQEVVKEAVGHKFEGKNIEICKKCNLKFIARSKIVLSFVI